MVRNRCSKETWRCKIVQMILFRNLISQRLFRRQKLEVKCSILMSSQVNKARTHYNVLEVKAKAEQVIIKL